MKNKRNNKETALNSFKFNETCTNLIKKNYLGYENCSLHYKKLVFFLIK